IDITARKEAETALRQAQKMEAIGYLTGGVAHDFNNLLQIITTSLDLLEREARGNPTAERRIAHARAGARRGSALTRQLLAFARRQTLDPVVIDPGRIVGGMSQLLHRTLGERIEVES